MSRHASPRPSRPVASFAVAAALAVALAAAVALIAVSPRRAAAQAGASGWEFRIASGSFVPTGAQRESLKGASLSAAQLTWTASPALAITGTFGWARSRDLGTAGSPKVDALSADLGAEVHGTPWFAGRRLTFRPFAGLGAGTRSYDYLGRSTDATHNLAGFGAIGGELGVGRVGVRLEVRDYVSGFTPLVGSGAAEARNDLYVMIAVRFNRHGAPRR